MKTDVAIVGAGPSGAWAAYRLARAGARVAIFDPSHPREKVCGGGVTGRALALVQPALAGRGLEATSIAAARFFDLDAGRSVSVPLGAGPQAGVDALTVVSRASFDAALLGAAREAGAAFVDARVLDVASDARGTSLSTAAGEWRAGFLIGADGANSLVRRRLAGAFPRGDLSMATGYFADGVTSDEIVLTLVSNPPGYIWSFPRPGHLAIGICASADAGTTTAALRARTRAWIAATGIAPGVSLRAYSWPIPSLSRASLDRLVVRGTSWCLAGDAAGLVDPITREGIYFALLSGHWAAEATLAGATGPYAARVRDELVPELARAARLKAGFFRPAFGRLLLDALESSPAIGAVMADLIAGEQSYAGLKWRLLGTGEWRLAWRALANWRSPQALPCSLGD
jgi:geranylgeranyl reductase family protein